MQKKIPAALAKKKTETTKKVKSNSLSGALQHLALIFEVSKIVAANNKND